MRVLIVDDQRSARRILRDFVEKMEDTEACEAASLDEARQLLEEKPFDIALVDVRLGPELQNRDGLTLVGEIRQRTNTVPVVVTSLNEMVTIRTAMRQGAFDFIVKDELAQDMVVPVLEEIRARRRLEREVVSLRARVGSDVGSELVGTSKVMQELRTAISRAALSDRPALVTGPTGAGKELVVRALHKLGPHPDEPLLDLNCGAIPEALVESQLFGHERGAFTGADRRQDGHLTLVRQGTLFLDEIAELPLLLQTKLLRILETGKYRAVGGSEELRFLGRIVAATHADLERRVAEGAFRQDLFYRLNVLDIRVPGLAEHREDISALVNHFAARQHRRLRFTVHAMELLGRMDWPGNVRELRNLIDRLAVFNESSTVTAEAIEALATPKADDGIAERDSLHSMARALLRTSFENKLDAFEEALVAEAMCLGEGNKSAAARLLGVHRKVVERRCGRPDSEEGSSPTEE